MQRRVASRFSREAAQQRRKLAGQPDPELGANYVQNLLAAFRSLYTDVKDLRIVETDFLYNLETRRRVNNILYYASLVLEVHPGLTGFRMLGVEETDMRLLLAQLVPDGKITNVFEVGIIHTIGAAYASLDETERAAAAGERLIEIAKQTEDATKLADALNDAFTWIQRHKELASGSADMSHDGHIVAVPA
jgi:hypothetical protein